MAKHLVIQAIPSAREFADSLVGRLSAHADSVTVQDVAPEEIYPLRINTVQHITEGGNENA